jgi:spore coat protein U-like protein
MACDVLGGRPARRRPILGVKVMKKILILAAMASVSTSAFASTTSTNPVVVFEGERAEVCEVRNFESVINFGSLSNLGNAPAKSDTLTLFCNVRYTATIESENGFLKLDTLVGPAQPTSQSDHTAQGYTGFSSALDYEVNTVLGTADTSLIGASTPVPLGGTQNPINQTTTITYDTIPESQPLLGGTYEDTLTLTITPISF